MAIYTTELRSILEQNVYNTLPKDLSLEEKIEQIENMPPDQIINIGNNALFDFDYPLYDDNYKSVLQNKISRHYYMREIGFETAALFKLRLNDKLNMIMPYYNQLYNSAALEINPLYNSDITTQHQGTGTEIGKTDTTSKSNDDLQKNYQSTTQNDNTLTNNLQSETTGSSTDNNTKSGNSSDTTHTTDAIDEGGSDKKYIGGKRTTSTDTNNTNSNSFSNTPQGSIANINNNTYLTDYRRITDNGSQTVTESYGDYTPLSSENQWGSGNYLEANYHNAENQHTIDSTLSKEFSENVEATASNTSTTKDTGTATNNDTTTVQGSENNINQNNSSSNVQNDIKTTDQYLQHIIGYSGTSTSKLLMEYRDTFLNIDKLIIDELQDLFMGVW